MRAKVIKVVANGAFVSYLGVLTGGLPEFHLPPGGAVQKGQEVRFIVTSCVYVHHRFVLA